MKRDLTITVRLESGSFWATVEELPGVFATGDTLDELRESLTEGVALYLSTPDRPIHGEIVGPLIAGPVESSTRVELAYA